MKKDAYKYSWNTWLTSLLLSPFVFMILNLDEILEIPGNKLFEILFFWIMILAVSYVPSLVSYFIFRFIVIKIVNTKWTITKRKNILAIYGSILTLLPLIILVVLNDEWMDIANLKLLIAYSTTTIFGIYYYKLPAAKQDDNGNTTSTHITTSKIG